MNIIVQTLKPFLRFVDGKSQVGPTTSTTITRKFKIKEMEDQEGPSSIRRKSNTSM